MRNGTYYLNNNGSRWVVYENGKKVKHTFQTTKGRTVTRTAIEFETFGNFCSLKISWRGKIISVLSDSVLSDDVWQVYSPDGFTISRDEEYTTENEAEEALSKWIKNYETQGYYSTGSREKIPVGLIHIYCSIKKIR
jgi:hypothetical protein